jgi:putative polyketide hydroxylase
MSDESVEVLVIGGGPVGLVLAIQMGRAGIRTLMIERKGTLSNHAKAGGVHARTMETFRQWGLANDIIKASGRTGEPFTIAWMTRMTGENLGSTAIGGDPADFQMFRAQSPEFGCGCGQDLYEPVLLAEARRHASAEVRFNTEAIAAEHDSSGVTVSLRDKTGKISTVRAAYVIGADGVRSKVREWAGLPETAEPSFGNSINIRFRAPLDRYRDGRTYVLWWIINKDVQGTFMWPANGDNWIFNLEADLDENLETYSEKRCIDLIRAAAGVPDLPVQIDSILYWKHNQAVTDKWRSGRFFIAGDSAHRFPPHGGFGMNSGVQDSLNLTWKLIAALRWNAGDSLLDTYEQERRPVARMNAEQSILNTHRMVETGWLAQNPKVFENIEEPEGAALREQIRSAIPKQREQFFSQGQQFGYIYDSAAIVDDGTLVETSTVSDYRPTAHPGARAPHLWLLDGQHREISTIDLYDSRSFILLTGLDGAAWLTAAHAVAVECGVWLKGFQIGGPELSQRPNDPAWTTIYGIGPDGAVLIRPDGHVAFRTPHLTEAPETTMRQVLSKILCRALT